MRIKKLILVIFIFISLNSFYQPYQINNTKTRHIIVKQINFDDDILTKEIINNNEKQLFKEFIAINIQIMLIDKKVGFYNTS